MLYISGLAVTMDMSETSETCTHFEYMDSTTNTGKVIIKFYIPRGPLNSKENGFRNSLFFDKWSKYIDNTLITGDFHFYLYNKSDIEGFAVYWIFVSIQHVSTHHNGDQTLDLVIS